MTHSQFFAGKESICVARGDWLLSAINHKNFGANIGLEQYCLNYKSQEDRLRRAASQRLSRLFFCHHARHDGGQYRARDQLLTALRKIQIAGTGRIRGAQPLDTVFAFRSIFRRARRSFRLPESDSTCANHVHGSLCSVGGAILYRHNSSVACLYATADPWDGGGALGSGKPVIDSRYCRHGSTAKRRAA